MITPRTGSRAGSSQFVTQVVYTQTHQSASTSMADSSAPAQDWFS